MVAVCIPSLAEGDLDRTDVKDQRKAYWQRLEIKECQQKRRKVYSQRPEIKEQRIAYQQRPEYKAKLREYRQRPEVKKHQREWGKSYYQRPEIREHIKQRMKEHNQLPEIKAHIKERRLKYHREMKLKVFEMLGGAKCVNCGCEDFDILEINHIDGYGKKEVRRLGRSLYEEIYLGRRKTDDLNVLCRVCNALDYLMRKKPESAKRLKIIWHPHTN